MPKQTLSFETVGDLDEGSLRIEFNKALKLIQQDLANRPLLEKKRSIALIIELKPTVDDQGSGNGLDAAEASWFIKTNVPSVSSEGLVMKPQQDGQLYFHSELPQDPDDETINDELRRNQRNRGE